MIDTNELDQIIYGKIEPHIYAFYTGTIPNYLKVGDTYRPVAKRIEEWKRPEFFPDLVQIPKEWSARLDERSYFRDYEVHKFLETDKGRVRLLSAPAGVYYSREFFKDATSADVDEAVTDITNCYKQNSPKYSYYSLEEKHSQDYHYERTASYPMRPNQETTVEKFKAAKDSGVKKMLMYAVMRFGKSFTSMQCALAMEAKFVLVVSGKADVKEEWKKTVESHIDFADYIFLTKEDLAKDNKKVQKILTGTSKPNKVVVFLTLQDLNGDEIKKHHKQIFSNTVDLLIIDETHFAARSEKYGKVLRDGSKQNEEFYTVDDAEKHLIKKHINANITLHLSGTPYRILMDGEFKENAIIADYKFSDIMDDQKKWYEDNRDKILKTEEDSKDPVYEWDNPYFGFPQMIRFAFNPNKASREKLAHLKDNGMSADFSTLFETYSNDATIEGYNKFKNESEVLDFLKVIDGTEDDDEVFAFLDYEKIKEGRMCRHIVMVLPYCASCDAMQDLLTRYSSTFKNLSKYAIINVSGSDRPSDFDDPAKVKAKISEYDTNDQKTITLTVNRMLTGCTVPEWDTMIYLKDTASPQEYDQAIFRLQSQFVKTYVKDNKSIKVDMKPQTLLVDFKPDRLFYLQAKKSGIHNVNSQKSGGNELQSRIAQDLEISPVIVMNHNKLERVDAPKIIEAVSKYSVERGVFDEVDDIPVDVSLMDNATIYNYISKLPDFSSKQGIVIPATLEDDGTNFDGLDDENNSDKDNQNGATPDGKTPSDKTVSSQEKSKKIDFNAKFKTYYSNVLYYAFLTDDEVNSVDLILETIDSPDNKRIAKNLGINKNFLKLLRHNINPIILGEWDNSIYKINHLSKDESVPPLQRAINAISQLSKISASEVKTPDKVCAEMVDLLPDDCLINAANEGRKILDIASKSGEFAVALCNKMTDLGIPQDKIQECIYAIPTSKMTYEFTLKFFRLLNLDERNITNPEYITSYSLLTIKEKINKKGDVKKIVSMDYDKICDILSQDKLFNTITLQDEVPQGERKVNFEAIIGNPPYQVSDGGAKASAIPIYNLFVELGKKINPSYMSLIMPSRWMTGGKGLDDFRKRMLNDTHIRILCDHMDAHDCFGDIVEIKGGVCYFLRDNNYAGLCNVITYAKDGINRSLRKLLEDGEKIFIRESRLIPIKNKIHDINNHSFESIVSSMKPFGLRGDVFQDYAKYKLPPMSDNYIEGGYIVYGLDEKLKRVQKYVNTDYPFPKKDYIQKYKLFMSRNQGAGMLGEEFSTPIFAKPGDCCTETFVVIGLFNNETEMRNCWKYIKTKLFRALVGVRKHDQGASKAIYHYVPIQDFTEHSDIDWSKSVAEIDAQLYKKYNLTPDEITFIETMIKPME